MDSETTTCILKLLLPEHRVSRGDLKHNTIQCLYFANSIKGIFKPTLFDLNLTKKVPGVDYLTSELWCRTNSQSETWSRFASKWAMVWFGWCNTLWFKPALKSHTFLQVTGFHCHRHNGIYFFGQHSKRFSCMSLNRGSNVSRSHRFPS